MHETDLDTVSADALGRALRGIGINLISRDVPALATFLTRIMGCTAHQVGPDFAIVAHDGMVLQLHSQNAFGSHPLHGLLPESGVAGPAVQIYLYNCDPDAAAERARAAGVTVIEPPADKPHGLREATILSDEGFAFTASVPLA